LAFKVSQDPVAAAVASVARPVHAPQPAGVEQPVCVGGLIGREELGDKGFDP
jgi:hypothetical protein